MPTLLKRRYIRPLEAVSRTEQYAGVVILLLLAGILGLMVWQVSTDRTALFYVEPESAPPATPPAAVQAEPPAAGPLESAAFFPDPGLQGWRAPVAPQRFSPETLFEKIDGAADAYLEQGFVELVFGRYERLSPPMLTVDAYCYDMGTPENAVAMYASERPPDPPAADVGEAGYQEAGAVFFRQDRYYVQLLPGRPGEPDVETVLKIAAALAQRLESAGADETPAP